MSQIVTISKKNFENLTARVFKCEIRGKIFNGFVVRKESQFFAYQNLCRHLPVTLDLNDAQFLTYDKKEIQCSMHGAVYNIETGHCTGGPCEGADLTKLAIQEENDRLIITVPDEFISE